MTKKNSICYGERCNTVNTFMLIIFIFSCSAVLFHSKMFEQSADVILENMATLLRRLYSNMDLLLPDKMQCTGFVIIVGCSNDHTGFRRGG